MKKIILLIKTACFMVLALNVSAQCPVTANAGADVTICPGVNTQLNASGGAFYSWSPSEGLSNASIGNPVASPASTTTYTVTVSSPSGELVTNGNFEAGATGFATDYVNKTGMYYPATTGLFPEGTYAVDYDPQPYHTAFNNSHDDHTTGSGKFMLVNGSTNTSTPLVWGQVVTVTPNTLYFFSTWVTSIHPNSPADLNFSINGTLLGPSIQAPAEGQWVQFYAEWTSGPSDVTADIRIVNLNPEPAGNDFGLDDISFTTVCSDTDELTVSVSNPSASVSASGSTTFCDGGSVTLTANEGSSYVWQPNGETSQSITVSASGSYSVTVTNADQCSATSAPVSVAVNTNPTPTVSASGATTFCQGGSVTLTSSSATGNVWSNGANTQSITVSSSGSYSVTVTDGNGCSGSSAAVTVTANPNPTPTISASGPTTFCAGGSVTLTSSYASGNVWSNGANTQSITVSSAGTYGVTVTDGNGCTGTSATPVTVGIWTPPAINIGADRVIYYGYGTSFVTFVPAISGGQPPYTVSWSPSATVTASSSNAGTTVVVVATVTDANGCTASDMANVCIADVRCGNKNDKVLVWHYPPGNQNNPQLLCIAPAAVPAHLSHHNDHLYGGQCVSGSGKMDDLSNEKYMETAVTVFPNPFNEVITFDVHAPDNSEITILVYDDKGALIATPYQGLISGEMNFEWNAAHLPSGFYFARIITPEEVFIQKLTK